MSNHPACARPEAGFILGALQRPFSSCLFYSGHRIFHKYVPNCHMGHIKCYFYSVNYYKAVLKPKRI